MLAFGLLQCVAEAVVENGVAGLAGMVPGGSFAVDVGRSVWQKLQQRRREDEVRTDLQSLAQLSFEQARQAAATAAREANGGQAPPIELELYLCQVPSAVKQSLKRPEDPSGNTVPASFALTSLDDVIRLLPPRPPRFRDGDPLPGRPGWVLVKPLGVGGFGEVWLARHPQMVSLVGAVKFCHGQQARDLRHEGGLIDRIMQQGEHPGIVRLKDVSLDGETPWLMYEYIAGGDLADWTRSIRRLPAEQRIRQVVAALRQLAGAVGHFHQLTPAIVHRDLKPSNILTDKVTRRLRITDFGIGAVAARASLGAEATGTATAGGRALSFLRGSHTPLYAPMQQRAGAAPDPRDDVHALGVIGYQLVTGHLDQGAGPDFDHDLRENGTPEALIALLGRCVAQKQDRRPRDGAELANALGLIEVGASSPSAPAASPPIVGLTATNSQSTPQTVAAPLPTTSPAGGLPTAAPPTPVESSPSAARGTVAAPPPGVDHAVLPPIASTTAASVSPSRPCAEPPSPLIAATATVPPVVPPDPLTPTPLRKAGEKVTVLLPGDVKMSFSWCPPGKFLMGSEKAWELAPDDTEGSSDDGMIEKSDFDDERPVHRVTLTKGLYMGTHPVTQAQWKAITGATPSHFKGDNRPVEQVSWNDCQDFCRKLTTHLNGRGNVRLPSEAEWEYSCRAGTTTEFYFGDEINTDLANYNGSFVWNESPQGVNREETTDVGSFRANPWGLFDMLGNVWEWCEDLDGKYPAKDQVDPIQLKRRAKGLRVVRGGSWDDTPAVCRAAARDSEEPDERINYYGCRVCFEAAGTSDGPRSVQKETKPRPSVRNTALEVTLPGHWLGRSARSAAGTWTYRCEVPAKVTIKSGEVYKLRINPSVTKEDLSKLVSLTGLSQLHGLWLSDASHLNDDDLRPVGLLTGLRELVLDGSAVTDVAFCRTLPDLQELRLSGTRLSDTGLEVISGLSLLRTLDIYGCPDFTSAGVQHLVRLTQLASLDIAHTPVDDAVVNWLTRLKCLESLQVEDTRITDAGFAKLADAFPWLERK